MGITPIVSRSLAGEWKKIAYREPGALAVHLTCHRRPCDRVCRCTEHSRSYEPGAGSSADCLPVSRRHLDRHHSAVLLYRTAQFY